MREKEGWTGTETGTEAWTWRAAAEEDEDEYEQEEMAVESARFISCSIMRSTRSMSARYLRLCPSPCSSCSSEWRDEEPREQADTVVASSSLGSRVWEEGAEDVGREEIVRLLWHEDLEAEDDGAL